ncbi:hypothetical protein [Actinokineospora sp.]|uniref:hypothetical protein n=1 Tax=Actinokineospora sp. TaxID=1872133 RepID=UPI003D6AAFBA
MRRRTGSARTEEYAWSWTRRSRNVPRRRDERGLDWDVEDGLWGARVERFLTNPMERPDPSQWHTEVAIRLAGQP